MFPLKRQLNYAFFLSLCNQTVGLEPLLFHDQLVKEVDPDSFTESSLSRSLQSKQSLMIPLTHGAKFKTRLGCLHGSHHAGTALSLLFPVKRN